MRRRTRTHEFNFFDSPSALAEPVPDECPPLAESETPANTEKANRKVDFITPIHRRFAQSYSNPKEDENDRPNR